MAPYTLIEIPKFASKAWAVEWMLGSSDRTGDWFGNAPSSDVSVEIQGITWSSAAVDIQGTNRHNIIPFTSGGVVQIMPGFNITGITSGATAKVVAVNLNTTGTWGAGTAAGDLIVTDVVGTFTATEEIYITGGAGVSEGTATLGVGSGTDYAHPVNDVEGTALTALVTGTSDRIFQIQENVNKIRPYLSTAGTNAFVRVTLYFSRLVTVIEGRS